jgi:hypothetical protein
MSSVAKSKSAFLFTVKKPKTNTCYFPRYTIFAIASLMVHNNSHINFFTAMAVSAIGTIITTTTTTTTR